METKDQDCRITAGVYTRVTVTLRHHNPGLTKGIPDIEEQIIALINDKAKSYFHLSKFLSRRCLTTLREGVTDVNRVSEFSRYCSGLIDGWMAARHGMLLHGIAPSLNISTESLERIPHDYMRSHQTI